MTGESPVIQVGSLALATRASGVCDASERGVCYEVYALGQRPGYSFLFEHGRYDGFSPEDVTIFLTITGEVCAAVADYQLTNVTQLARDFKRGRFAAAFPPRPPAPPRNDTAWDTRLAAYHVMNRLPSLERNHMTTPSPIMSPEAYVHRIGNFIFPVPQVLGTQGEASRVRARG